ncbi:MAG: NUDIX hydrolase [Muribaculaceae bacterium]|nr:NUDIX hydrolase [Muribaculaceae bacterium]
MSNSYYQQQDRLYISVDCIVFGLCEGELKLLLTKRDFEPHKGEWSLMGGFVRHDESVDNAARRVLKNLTGLDGIYMQQVKTFGEVNRDSGERVVSVAYSALLNLKEIKHCNLEGYNAQWFDYNNIPDLCMDHNKMIEHAMLKIRHRLKTEPLAFKLLPQRFTLSQFQSLYEMLMGTKVDKRNFRRRALENDCIVSTEFVDKENSRRGARLYEYRDNLALNN